MARKKIVDKSLPKFVPVPPVETLGGDKRTEPPLYATSKPGYRESLAQFNYKLDKRTSLPVGTPISDEQSVVDRPKRGR